MIDKKLYALLGNDKKYVAYISVLSIAGMIANIIITATICYTLYLVSIVSQSVASYSVAAAIILLGIIIKVIISKTQATCKIRLGSRVKSDLRKNIYRRITDLGSSAASGESTAGITQIAVDGIEQLDLYYTVYLPQLFYALISPILLFCLCVAIDYRTALVLLFCVPIIPIAIIGVSKYAKKIFNKYWNQYINLGDTFLDNLQGMQELKIFNADSAAQSAMDGRSEEFRKVTMKVLVMQLMSITIMDIVAFGGAGLGIAIALTSGVNAGLAPILVLFLILVSAEFFLPMRSLGSAFHIAMNGAQAGKRILAMLEIERLPWGTKQCTGGDISLRGVEFGYSQDKKVLCNACMQFKRNSFTAIVGESGCGKSTIISLIIGKILPSIGGVSIGDCEIRSFSRESYYSNIAMVSYNTFVFGMSIGDNFHIAKSGATDEEIFEVLRAVNLYQFVLDSGGLDSVINEGASNISGGERQRLALAINLVADKSIYIFDEATSNIDVESESIIMDNINKLALTKTVILVSHRLANVLLADNIYMLQDGVVIESGSHKQLMNNNMQYCHLYCEQKRLENAYKPTDNIQNHNRIKSYSSNSECRRNVQEVG